MFSGIIQEVVKITKVTPRDQVLELTLPRPSTFADLKIGDSVATNGVCLTVESLSDHDMIFVLAAETLQVTGWEPESLINSRVNLEQSLRLGDRIHGHLVSGHVDTMGSVWKIDDLGENRIIQISYPYLLLDLIWKKGSITVNGVSLTVNKVIKNSILEVCLIPETIRATNLGELSKGDLVTLEADYLARGMQHMFKNKSEEKGLETDFFQGESGE